MSCRGAGPTACSRRAPDSAESGRAIQNALPAEALTRNTIRAVFARTVTAMARSTARASGAAGPVSRAPAAIASRASRLVDAASAAGTAVPKRPGTWAAHSHARSGPAPRSMSRVRSRFRARLSRLLTVPRGQPRCRAACSWLRPSRSQSTTGTRKYSGSRSISSWSTRAGSSLGWWAIGLCSSAARCSCLRLRAAALRQQDAVRIATWCSHGPNESCTQSPRAFRTRTRNVA